MGPLPDKSLFAPGKIHYSSHVQAALKAANAHGIVLLSRHLTGDWGQVDEKRQFVNRWAATHKEPHNKNIISRYMLSDGTQVAIITTHVNDRRQRRTEIALWPEIAASPEKKKKKTPKKKRGKKNGTTNKDA
jgi:hypothetical protein